jgi:cytoskeletal protein RodZ
MVTMWVVLLAVVLVVLGAAAAVLFRRPKSTDLSSVRKYHSALGTMEHLSEHTGPPPVRVVGGQGAPGHDPVTGGGPGTGGRAVPPVPVRGNDGFPDPGDPLVFDDARPADRYRVESSRPGGVPARTDRAQRQALESMNRRPRRGVAVAAVIIVVLLIGALALVGRGRAKPTAHSHTGATSTVSATTPTTGANPGSSSTSAPSGSAHRGARHANRSGRNRRSSTTTTTRPTQVVAVASTAASATYPVGTTSYQVTVAATAPCWVLATSTASGSTLWTGTLQAGASQVIQASGPATVELGALSATLTLDGVPVTLPNPVGAPFVATFQPTATATATPGATPSAGTPSSTSTTAG